MKRVAAILTILLCSAFLWGCAFAVLEENHECSGDKCPVCFCIALSQNVIRNLSHQIQTGNIFFTALILFSLFIFHSLTSTSTDTLITLKVKLTD